MADERVPEGELFHLMLTWTKLQMESIRDFETYVDHMLRLAKQHVMQTYRDHQPPPFALTADEEPDA